MSEKADRNRSKRQIIATPGSGLDKIVSIAQVLFPTIIGVLAAWFSFSPFVQVSELSFLLDKNEVEIAPQRVKVTNAEYRGEDSRNRPFSIRAKSAVQRSSEEPIVELSDMVSRMDFTSGPGIVTAKKGEYDMKAEKMRVIGPVEYSSQNGYSLTTSNVDIDLKSRTLRSRDAVNGSLPVGTFSADQMRVDLDKQIVELDGNAHLRIVQTGGM